MAHASVLKKEILDFLNPQPGQNFIDCNVGLAGHSLAILERVKPSGQVLGIDLDQQTLNKCEEKEGLLLVCGNFKDLKKIKEAHNFSPVHGILFDLGLSSWQLDESNRGFTFQKDEPLLMSFGTDQLTAYEIVNSWPEQEIADIIFQYGEERLSRRIAKQIVMARKNKKIETTKELVNLIERAMPASQKHKKIHFATKTFQALRIAVNDELNNLLTALPQALEIVEPQGRIAVISFHSLEDRIVKNFFRDNKRTRLNILTKKPLIASEQEISINPRSRSAKLRVAEKI